MLRKKEFASKLITRMMIMKMNQSEIRGLHDDDMMTKALTFLVRRARASRPAFRLLITRSNV